MDISIQDRVIIAYKKAKGKNKSLLEIARSGSDYDGSSSGLDSDFLKIKDVEKLIQLFGEERKFRDAPWKRRQLRVLNALLNLKQGKTKRVANLEVMAGALRDHLMPLQNHWVFIKGFGGQLLPWFVVEIEYLEAERRNDHRIPARIHFELKAKYRGESKKYTETVYRESLGSGGCTPGVLLSRMGFLGESEELREAYEKEMVLYNEWRGKCGEQFMAVGKGKPGPSDEDDDNDRRWWHSNDGVVKLDRDGGPSRCVMDDEVGFGDEDSDDENQSVFCNNWYWYRARSEDEKEEYQETSDPVPAPIHPVVCVFSMMTHEFLETHITNLTPYEYDAGLSDKLVLPKDSRKLIDVLIDTSVQNSEDIVKGKKGGVVMLCSGPPGTGKTLTAEVYAEIAKRPLYPVQCSQLGVDSEGLEKELGKVLRRSSRWNTITLIDEADVYIHERGTDVNQNAIVGVFLRVLEYHSGVLFLTTNRETVIDDAISSRCIAHVKYRIAETLQDRIDLWAILSNQYDIRLNDVQIKKLIEVFPCVSGRTIKQLCRLAQAMGRNLKPDLKLFSWLAKFQDVETGSEE